MCWLRHPIKNNGKIAVVVNPLMLKGAKSSLAILTGKSIVGKISDGEILIRTLPRKNSPSNILPDRSQFQSYSQKYK